ncbi:MAG: 3-dehydroquinate synthase [Planctomycetota bacterium]
MNTKITCGRGILRAEACARLKSLKPKPSHVFVVIDRKTEEVVGRKIVLAAKEAGLAVTLLLAPVGEARKTLEAAERLASQLVRKGADRKSLLIAVGGGVTSDLTGFVAANLFRGIDWAVIPTTLLAMTDASIGGKTAVNLNEGKNLFGAFHFPKFVVSDVQMLRTLPLREWRSGMGEVLKTAMLSGSGMYRSLLAATPYQLQRSSAKLSEFVTQCARFKQKLVRRDPLEGGERKLLNLGHTFGHALETSAGPRRLAHGEAVALGLLCALQMSAEQELCAASYASEVLEFLKRNGMKTRFPGEFPSKRALEKLLLRDKKAAHGQLDLILPVKPGTNLLVQGVDAGEVAAGMHRYLG